MRHPRSAGRFDLRRAQVRGAADRERGVGDLARRGGCGGNQVLCRTKRTVGSDHDEERGVEHAAHRNKIFLWVIGQFLEQGRIDGQMTYIGKKKVVARGRCLFHGPGSNETTAAWPGIDQDGLLPSGRQLFRDNPRDHIGPAACGKCGNDAHRLRREGLGPGQRRGQAKANACSQKGK